MSDHKTAGNEIDSILLSSYIDMILGIRLISNKWSTNESLKRKKTVLHILLKNFY